MTTSVQNSSFLSQRAAVLGAIVALHFVVIYALSSGLAGRMVDAIAPPIQTEIIQEIEHFEEPPPIALPEMEEPRIEVMRPRLAIKIPPEPRIIITPVAQAKPSITLPPPAPIAIAVSLPTPASAPVKRRSIVHANIGKNFPNPDDFYPPSSLRMEEEGAVGVRACVGPNGKLLEPPSVIKSSGNPRLDQAAVALTRVGHYLAASIDGVPVKECLLVPIQFHMAR